jgi:hypothetical protein
VVAYIKVMVADSNVVTANIHIMSTDLNAMSPNIHIMAANPYLMASAYMKMSEYAAEKCRNDCKSKPDQKAD